MIKTTADWFVAAGQMEEKPKLDFQKMAFYIGMQLEELAEKLEVIFGPEGDLPKLLQKEATNFKCGDYTSKVAEVYSSESAVDFLDADMDLIWVSIGAALASGADAEGAYKAVASSNWAKFPDGKVLRDPQTGKILKPDGWSPPDLRPYIYKG